MKEFFRNLAAKALEAMVTALGQEVGRVIAKRIAPKGEDEDGPATTKESK